MKQNIGTTDKMIRILIGMIIMGAGFYYQSLWGLIGLIVVTIALIGWCPPYDLFGLNTCGHHCDTENHAPK